MNLGYLVVRFFFLNSGNLICLTTGISMYFREFLGVRDNESRLYKVASPENEFIHINPLYFNELFVLIC